MCFLDALIGLARRDGAWWELNNLEPAEEGRLLRRMGHSQGRDNVKKRATRRKKTERLALAKNKKKAAAKGSS